jgi:hypothetical protein
MRRVLNHNLDLALGQSFDIVSWEMIVHEEGQDNSL